MWLVAVYKEVSFEVEIGCFYKGYVRPVTLHGSEAWCLNESEMGIL